jgi:hypothetical protein
MWWKTKGYSLVEHGDRYERLWWPALKNDFPEYERFWINHVIPLTNRINPEIPPADPKWIGFRDDPEISDDLEAMARAHYSTFYFLARATLLIAYEPHIYFEDAFALLAGVAKNAKRFVGVWQRGLTNNLKLSSPSLPGIDVLSWPAVQDIHLYRNVLVHAPVLGRAQYLDAELLPKKQFLPKDDHTERGRKPKAGAGWRALQKLAHTDFVEGRALLTELKAELIKSLREAWGILCEIGDKASETKEYRDLYNLDEQYVIRGLRESVAGATPSEQTLNIYSPPASAVVQVIGSATVHPLPGGDPTVKPKP